MSSPPAGPPGDPGTFLEGVRVLDAGSFLAAPYAAQLLADWGADVVKAEPLEGDASRRIGAQAEPLMSATFAGANRGKRSIALDLRSSEGRATLARLAATSDVVIHNHAPAVARSLGIDAEAVLAARPGAVVCSISAYGPDGPASGRTALDPIIQAASGLSSLTGVTDGEPMRCAAPVVDIGSALAAAGAILAALYRSAASGRGASVSVALFDVALTYQSSLFPLYSLNGRPLPRRANGSFALLGDQFAAADGFVALVVWDDERWRALCALLDLEALATDPRFATNDLRHENYASLRAPLAAAVAARPVAQLREQLDAAGIPNDLTRDYDQLSADEHVCSTGALYREDRLGAGGLLMAGGPARDGAGRMAARRPPPRLGEHTAELLGELDRDAPASTLVC